MSDEVLYIPLTAREVQAIASFCEERGIVGLDAELALESGRRKLTQALEAKS